MIITLKADRRRGLGTFHAYPHRDRDRAPFGRHRAFFVRAALRLPSGLPSRPLWTALLAEPRLLSAASGLSTAAARRLRATAGRTAARRLRATAARLFRAAARWAIAAAS